MVSATVRFSLSAFALSGPLIGLCAALGNQPGAASGQQHGFENHHAADNPEKGQNSNVHGSGGLPVLTLATWNLNWWMGLASFAEWKQRCQALNPPKDLSLPPCKLSEPNAPNFHTDAQVRLRRLAQFRAVIRAARPDVLLMQEIRDTPAATELLTGLGYTRVWTSFENVPVAQSVGFAVRDGIDVAWPPTAVNAFAVEDQATGSVGNRLRPGGVLQANVAGHSVKILNLHLKAGCRSAPIDQAGDSEPGPCATLRAQVPVLESWIEARVDAGENFIIGGDFNRSSEADFAADTPARLDGSIASDPLLPATRVGSLLKEISDDAPPDASLVFPRRPVPGQLLSKCHKDIDYIALGAQLSRQLNKSFQGGSFSVPAYRYADTPVPPQGPSDHCMVILELGLRTDLKTALEHRRP